MRHQIKILFTAIIIIAGLATSALKADEIEGTWTQDGQYKKFSKEYSNLQLMQVSSNKKEIAIVSSNRLTIFEIESGKKLFTKPMGEIMQYDNPFSFAISKDLKFVGINKSKSEYVENNTIQITFQAAVFDIGKNTKVIDTIIKFAYEQIEAYPQTAVNSYFDNNNNYYSQLAETSGRWYRSTGYLFFVYNCNSATIDTARRIKPFDIIFTGNKSNYSAGYLYEEFTDDLQGTPDDYYRFSKKMFIKKDTNVYDLAKEYWEYRDGEPQPPHDGFCPYPIGFTADDKMLMTQSENKYIFYDLDSIGKSHTITNKYFDNTNPIILFPNDTKGDNYLTLKKINENLFIRRMNYKQENEISSYLIDKYKIEDRKFTKMIDSSKIITYLSPYIYLLDLKTITTVPELDIVSSKTSATTNDTLQFEVINPKGLSNLSIDFGDGNLTNEHSVKHIYSKPGTYTISVSGKDKTGQITTYEKKDYINITQGLVLDFNVEVSYNQDSIKIQVINTTQGEHLNQNISIIPGFDLKRSVWCNDCDSASANFSGLGFYHISLQKKSENSYNVLFRKDTIIEITGPKLGIISSEKCLNTNFRSYGYKGFKNIGSVDLFGSFDDSYYENTYTFPIVLTLNDQDKIINTFKSSERGFYGSLSKFGISKYSFSMITKPSAFYAIFDLKENKIDTLPYYLEAPFNYFMYDDTTYGIINKNSDIILYSINSNQKLSILAEHSAISPQSTQIIKNNNEIIDFINPGNDIKVVKSSIDTKNNTIRTQEIETQLLSSSTSYFKYSLESIMEISDGQYLTFYANKIFKLNFHTSQIDTLTFLNDDISNIIKVDDNSFAIITYNKNRELVLNIADSNFVLERFVSLPLRTGAILYSGITVDNQLKLIFSSSTCNLYICKIRIGDLASVQDDNIITKEMPLIFPNPAANTISIAYTLSLQASVSIVDESGREYTAEVKSINTDNFSIDTSLLPDGLYFVQIQDGEINQSVKFIVKR